MDGRMTSTKQLLLLVKILCLTLLPILVLWAYSVFRLTGTISKNVENQRIKDDIQLCIKLGELVHHLQQERDMTVLYLSALGAETKIFLLTEYVQTDKAIDTLSKWPSQLEDIYQEKFGSSKSLKMHLSRHREMITKNSYDLHEEIQFYTSVIDTVIGWLYKSITKSEEAQVWKMLVAYLKLTSAKQDIGIERALGTLFYVNGRFQSQKIFEMYNNRINRFRAFYTTSKLYSSRVDTLYTSAINDMTGGEKVLAIINKYRNEIQHYTENRVSADIQNARYWFDNMTLYLDTLLNAQRDLGNEIIQVLDAVIKESTQDFAISISFLVIVLPMCPLVIFVAERLTRVIQKKKQCLAVCTSYLSNTRSYNDALLSIMMPSTIAEKIRLNKKVDVEYFQSVTVLMIRICGFEDNFISSTASEIITMIETMYREVDTLVLKFDVNKLEGADGSMMVFSGFPHRNNVKHVLFVADFALQLIESVIFMKETSTNGQNLAVKTGMATGHCTAGVIGKTLPRYFMVGNTVSTSKELQNQCPLNKIHISADTHDALRYKLVYVMQKVERQDWMKATYFLQGKESNDVPQEACTDLPGYVSDDALPGPSGIQSSA